MRDAGPLEVGEERAGGRVDDADHPVQVDLHDRVRVQLREMESGAQPPRGAGPPPGV